MVYEGPTVVGVV